jgi:hypothetical protein
MSTKRPHLKAFRMGRRGACESHLFEFELFATDGTVGTEARRIAASSLLEAVTFLTRDEPEQRIRSVRDAGVILLLSGSPYA